MLRAQLIAIALLVACQLVGCNRPGDRTPYNVLLGAVESVQHEIGEIGVRVPSTRTGDPIRIVTCVFDGRTEIYINDRMTDRAEIRPGDQIEVLGTPEVGSKTARMIAVIVHITRMEPRPAPPIISADAPRGDPNPR